MTASSFIVESLRPRVKRKLALGRQESPHSNNKGAEEACIGRAKSLVPSVCSSCWQPLPWVFARQAHGDLRLHLRTGTSASEGARGWRGITRDAPGGEGDMLVGDR